jgi:hypothetical protein
MPVDDEQEVEDMIAALREALDADPGRFTTWERSFIESVEEQNDVGFLSATQREKLEELHDEKC